MGPGDEPNGGSIEPRTLPGELVGGRLCLDFINTVHSRDERPLRDYLTDYQALLGWARLAGAVERPLLETLAGRGRRHAAEARRCLHRALALRETLYALTKAVIAERPPGAEQVAALNGWLAETAARRRLEYVQRRFVETWHAPADELAAPLWPVVDSARRLLTGADLDRLRECPGPGDGCGWLFFDDSKNRSRRWCSMKTCGNLAKVRRHYRRRAARPSS